MGKKIVLENADRCTGCGACIASCPHGAIVKKPTGVGSWIPKINSELCVQCGLCERICHKGIVKQSGEKKAYIAYNKEQKMRILSASGGVFSALSAYVLERGGSVFGAEMRFEQGKAIVEHVKVTKIEDLPKILGSKYVQSDCISAYKQVKQDLQAKKTVLFSGCSCQVTGLKKYLGEVDQTNLYTIDLICHGVPGLEFFNDYIDFLEDKFDGQVVKLSFRTKESEKIVYEISGELVERHKRLIKKFQIPIRTSGYYRMFMMEESYQKICYKCPYDSLDKPADITIGDYFEAKDDYPELFRGDNAIDCNGGISCAITHNNKGEELLQKAIEYLYLKEVDPKVVQASHGNLHRPSKHSKARAFLRISYLLFGYKAIEKFYDLRNRFADAVKK